MPKLTAQTLIIVLALSLAACSSNPTPIFIPASTNAPINTTASTAAPTNNANAPTAAAPAVTAPAATPTAKLKLNLNEATREELLTVPNAGPQMVREFLEYRPYASIQQFRKELSKYIKADQIAEYEKYVYVPVNINKADAETLKKSSQNSKTIEKNSDFLK